VIGASSSVRWRPASGQRTLLLGIATLVCALTDGAIIATYEGPALVPDRFLAVLLAVFILSVLTVVSFTVTVNKDRHRSRNIVGLVLGLTAVPVTCVLLTITYTVLQTVFHLYW
jgi:hypothetical protein